VASASLASCSRTVNVGRSSPSPAAGSFGAPSRVTPEGGQRVVTQTLTARSVTLDLGGRRVETWAYGDTLPGPVVRASAGDFLRVWLDNALPDDTTIH